MRLKFVIFRYQPGLANDHWIPLAVVSESPLDDGAEIGVVCLKSASADASSDLAAAMLQDVPAVLTREVQSTCERLLPHEDFLELLRAQNPWNFHFTAPREQDVRSASLAEGTMQLFHQHVLGLPAPRSKARRGPPKAIQPRRIEAYELAV